MVVVDTSFSFAKTLYVFLAVLAHGFVVQEGF